jgi:predicted DNA-binding transcriptional regulator AlpA
MLREETDRRGGHQFLTSKQVRERYGSISDMSLWRWLNDESDFPQPMRINNRRYWAVTDLEAWEEKRRGS